MVSDFTAAVIVQILLVGLVVAILLIGGTLLVSLGMMTKRPGDRIGKHAPSDFGLKKDSAWPERPEEPVLPAVEEDTTKKKKRPHRAA